MIEKSKLEAGRMNNFKKYYNSREALSKANESNCKVKNSKMEYHKMLKVSNEVKFLRIRRDHWKCSRSSRANYRT
jgi:hypothetical protein